MTTNARPNADPMPQPNALTKRLRPILLIAMLLAVWIAYATSFSGTFVFDDENQILQNPEVTEQPVLELFQNSTRPLVNLTLALDYRLAGGQELESIEDLPSTTPFHLTNLIVHSLVACTLFALIAGTLRLPMFVERFSPQRADLLAFVVATLWALHPLTTQSVTYIVQRAEAMMALFYLLTLYTLLRTATSAGAKSAAWSTACVAACALGMGSKAVMLTAPLAALAYDHTFLARNAIDALKQRFPLYICLACTWSILSLVGLVRGVFNPPATSSPSIGFNYKGVSPLDYFLTQPEVILHYLRLAVAPVGLTLDYRWPVQDSLPTIAITTAIVTALGVLTVWQLYRRTWLGFVGALFFLVLSTTSSFIPIADLAFEHRMYLPLACVVLVVCTLAWKTFTRITSAPAHAAALAFVVAAVALGGLTASRNNDYRSAISIWADTFAKQPTNDRAASNYASMLAREGRVAEAIPVFERSLELKPDAPEVHAKYARALVDRGRTVEAIGAFEKALEINPDIALVTDELTAEYIKIRQWDRAAELGFRAVEKNPDRLSARSRLVTALIEAERFDEAVEQARELARRDPENAGAYQALGAALRGQGKLGPAVDAYQRALALNAGFLRAAIELANVYTQRDQQDLAFELLTETAALPLNAPDPIEWSLVHHNLANTTFAVRVNEGVTRRDVLREMLPHYEKAAEIRPSYANAHFGIGWCNANLGNRALAIRSYREALRLNPSHARARAELSAIESQ